ncbi:MAG: exodeoxyribonuclease VII small subunit [Oleiphilaceae bacterium]|jgi:exodeoxyribonuclease VII small subunit
MPKKNSADDFETSLQALEDIVSKMEQGTLSLEQSLEAFEQGVQLTRTCQSTLKEAEQRVSKLTQKDESYALDSLNTEEKN